MLAFFVYFAYIALNIFITPALDSLHTLTGALARVPSASLDQALIPSCCADHQAYVLPQPSALARGVDHPLLANSVCLPEDAVPPLHDLPIGLVNRVVFGDHRRKQGKGWGRRSRRGTLTTEGSPEVERGGWQH